MDVYPQRIACVASHSALDVFDGAKDEGLGTVAICKTGRDSVYKALNRLIDFYIDLSDYKEMLNSDSQNRLRELGCVVVPNRSMTVYVGYDQVERSLEVPVFGNRRLLKWEERVGAANYYRLFDEAGVRRPKLYANLDEVDGPVLLKVQEAKRPQERAFIYAVDREDLTRKVRDALASGVIKEHNLRSAVAEELVLGAHFNVNYFFSVVNRRLEIISIDRRIQSNVDGLTRLPARVQMGLDINHSMIEVGHVPCTMRESVLNECYEIGLKVLEASRRLEPPGLIGPFTVQLFVTPELRTVAYDFAPRIGGGTNAHMGIGGNYSKLWLGRSVSMGRRIAIEIRESIEQGRPDEVLT
ncbi:MAG: formate--phosphoribosylaminoimidazolecarboxamide ligase family protein [Thaumarchaeota archaeon]|nr:formate--phosphoribosylaminoimidazolecarboxamide ligase family protein [Candidatus Calditenuaceae archaeon]MDW8187117.1 formate--phosphoribosylaminoimidazolecarboxamide ligase family protein [Nitrososphaerota archaeon]